MATWANSCVHPRRRRELRLPLRGAIGGLASQTRPEAGQPMLKKRFVNPRKPVVRERDWRWIDQSRMLQTGPRPLPRGCDKLCSNRVPQLIAQ
jgi:hypothetical protein